MGLRSRAIRLFGLRYWLVAGSPARVPFNEYVIGKSIEGVDFNFLIGDTEGQEW